MSTFREIDFQNMERRYRSTLMNAVSGFKSLCLCGTVSPEGVANLATISSVVHIGANPPFQGFIMRPTTVERQTYAYLKSTGYFTLNHVTEAFYRQAHQCAARYPADVSEFMEVGLTPEYSEVHPAPYVAESPLKMGLRFVEEKELVNGTILIIGALEELVVDQEAIGEDGFLDVQALGTITVSGLDAYYRTERIERLSYAKPNQPLRRLDE